MERESRTRWGRIAFGAGIVTCVVAGAVVGVILGSEKGDSGKGVLPRVTALALDTRGLNDDALALSQAIEEAIEREELEGEASGLRARLAVLEERAARIRARAKREAVSPASAEPVSDRAERRWARRGLAEVRAAVAVFDRQVASNLEEALTSPSGSTATNALAKATAVAQRQSAAMARLSRRASATADPRASEEPSAASGSSAAAPGLGGSFPVSYSNTEGEPLEAEYELEEVEADVEESTEPSGGWEVTATTSGNLGIDSGEEGPQGAVVPPLLMVLFWEESELPLAVRDNSWLQSGDAPAAEEGLEEEFEAEPEAAPASCRYRLRGRAYCALAAFGFGEEEGAGPPTAPGSVEEAEFGNAATVATLQIGSGAGEAAAEAVAELLGDQEPALVQVVEAAPEGLLAPVCESAVAAVEPGEEIATGGTVALLDDGGSPIFEVETERSTRVPPPCFQVTG